ncbi:hypothetical protein WA158_004965 [Blastocystis sp. Blastoise]
MKLIIVYRKKEYPVEVNEKQTVLDFKKDLKKQFKLSVERQALKIDIEGKEPIRFDNDEKLMIYYFVFNYDLPQVKLRDLGPQIGYRTVFIFEYLGPLLIMLLLSYQPSFIYGQITSSMSAVAKRAVLCWELHYLKRLFETFFVHKFSRGTMPLTNLFKNCTYYWGFAFYVGYTLCSPLYTPPTNMKLVRIATMAMLICELINGAVHLQFRFMRGTDKTSRPMPTGFLFALVSCPNYTAEVCSWICFSTMTHSFPSILFTLCGFYQMTEWALKKHRNYIKVYGTAYKNLHRKAIVPFLL